MPSLFFQCRRTDVQHPVSNFRCAPLIPELGSDITACAAGYIHFRLVAVSTLRTFPNQLSVFFDNHDFTVVSAHLAIVALGVQLGVHDVVVDVLDNAEDCRDVVLHIGHLDIGDCSAGRECLKLGLKIKLRESVNLLADVDMEIGRASCRERV